MRAIWTLEAEAGPGRSPKWAFFSVEFSFVRGVVSPVTLCCTMGHKTIELLFVGIRDPFSAVPGGAGLKYVTMSARLHVDRSI